MNPENMRWFVVCVDGNGSVILSNCRSKDTVSLVGGPEEPSRMLLRMFYPSCLL